MKDEIPDFVVGVLCTILFFSLFFFLRWYMWTGIRTTSDGQFYIKTHWKVYKLVSDKPVEIITSLKEK